MRDVAHVFSIRYLVDHPLPHEGMFDRVITYAKVSLGMDQLKSQEQ